MLNMLKWMDTTGGPHLLVSEEYLHNWHGVEGWRDHQDPSDNSDYARACRVHRWIGKISCGSGEAIVLSGDVGPVALIDTPERENVVLAQWIYADDEAELIEAVGSGNAFSCLADANAEQLEFIAANNGTMYLIDSTEIGSDLMSSYLKINVPPGPLAMHAGLFTTPRSSFVIRCIAGVQ